MQKLILVCSWISPRASCSYLHHQGRMNDPRTWRSVAPKCQPWHSLGCVRHTKKYVAANGQVKPIQVATLSKSWVCGRLLAGIAGSNPTGVMEVCRLRLTCVVRCRSLRRAHHSSRGVPPTMVCLSMIEKPR